MKNIIDKPLVLIKKFLLNVFNNKFQSIENKIRYEILINGLQEKSLNSIEKGVSEEKYIENQIIVSLTSYSSRLYNVHLTIESLLNQTLKPNKIILWLNEPYTIENIPLILKKQIKRGLIIEFVEDFRSYDKLIHSLIKHPKDTIITCDDDVIYPYDFVERLVIEHIKDRKSIFFYQGARMTFDKNNNLLPYSLWDENSCTEEDSVFHFPYGNCGILYPPNSLHKEVLNIKSFIELSPYADDIWFRAMSILNDTPCKKVKLEINPYKKMIAIGSSQNITLWHYNVTENNNQIKNVFSKYKIYDKLKKL